MTAARAARVASAATASLCCMYAVVCVLFVERFLTSVFAAPVFLVFASLCFFATFATDRLPGLCWRAGV